LSAHHGCGNFASSSCCSVMCIRTQDEIAKEKTNHTDGGAQSGGVRLPKRQYC
jgi:hypothetical protein